MVGRGCSVVTSVGLSGSRSFSMDGVLFVESDPVVSRFLESWYAVRLLGGVIPDT